ncbi:MAG TPA: BamA/TamA family outer membrane protein [Longimicrobiales bacterium]|nr:BamA/TamA family outer membrane protein [Longimicrobiales bacterium]
MTSAASLAGGGCATRASTAQLYPELVEHSGAKIEAVRFTGHDPFTADSLLTMIGTQPSRCSFLGLPLCVPFTRIGRQEHFLQPELVRSDLLNLARFYRAEGYFGTRVMPEVESGDDDVAITFAVQRGDPIIVDLIEVEGTEPVLPSDSMERVLRMQPGEIFALGEFSRSADQVLNALYRRGHAYAEVLRNFSVDTVDNRAVALLEAVPGPEVRVDSIIVEGADQLGRRTALRAFTFRPGDLLLQSRLAESQRNLYELGLVQIASVSIAEDSLQRAPGDSSTATVAVRIAEGPVHQVDAAVGFGTVECLRTEATWVSRSFGGGARRLAVHGSLSKIGIGEPFDIGSGDKVCRAYAQDEVAAQFDYRLSADLTQPFLFGPRNQGALNVFAERISEPTIYEREAIGARVGVARRVGDRSILSLGLDGERGSTRAAPALFCAAFQVCDPSVVDSLAQPRFRNELSAGWSLDRSDIAFNPTRGYGVRTSLAWAAPWLASDIRFVRGTAEGTIYRPVRPGWVAAGALRLGNFFRTASIDPTENFLPPEERFYAGGASTVRGYDRNALGPGVWVTDDSVKVNEDGDTIGMRFVPTGGTALAVASAELRFPSPFLPRTLRMVAFVDAGAVGRRSVLDLSLADLRATPGLGLRVQTPVGPIRLDAAYNPYNRPAGPLLVADTTNALIRVADEFRPSPTTFFGRFRIHLGIGQAF